MEKRTKSYYKYCIVPMCGNNNKITPGKLFFHVPKDANVRKIWCQAMRRENVSCLSSLYCCEDHFDIKNDTQNYMKYRIMALEQGQKYSLLLKKGVAPYKFQCQKKYTKPPPTKRECTLKRKQEALVEEVLADADLSLARLSGAGPSTASTSKADLLEAVPSTTLWCNVMGYVKRDQIYRNCEPSKFSWLNNDDLSDSICEDPLSFKEESTVSEFCDNLEDNDDKSICSTESDTKENIDIEDWSIPSIKVETDHDYAAVECNQLRIKSECIEDSITTSINPSTTTQDWQCNVEVKCENFDDTTDSECTTSIPDMTEEFSSLSNLINESQTILDNTVQKQFPKLLKPEKINLQSTLSKINKNPQLYIGLPKNLVFLIDIVAKQTKLLKEDILLCLMRVKLNRTFTELGDDFDCTISQASRMFQTKFPTIAKVFLPLIKQYSPEATKRDACTTFIYKLILAARKLKTKNLQED